MIENIVISWSKITLFGKSIDDLVFCNESRYNRYFHQHQMLSEFFANVSIYISFRYYDFRMPYMRIQYPQRICNQLFLYWTLTNRTFNQKKLVWFTGTSCFKFTFLLFFFFCGLFAKKQKRTETAPCSNSGIW